MGARNQAKSSQFCLKPFLTIIIRFRLFGTMVIEGEKFSKFGPLDEIFFVPRHFLSKFRFWAPRSCLDVTLSTWNVLCLLLIWAQLFKYVRFEKIGWPIMSQRWLISLISRKKACPGFVEPRNPTKLPFSFLIFFSVVIVWLLIPKTMVNQTKKIFRDG